jgi:hypothetical protein
MAENNSLGPDASVAGRDRRAVRFLVWGGGIWVLLIFKGSYDNIVAMFGASLLMCMGVLFFFFKRKH